MSTWELVGIFAAIYVVTVWFMYTQIAKWEERAEEAVRRYLRIQKRHERRGTEATRPEDV